MILLNGVQVVPTIFPDHTSQVWKLPDGVVTETGNVVTWDFQEEREFMHLAQLRELLPRGMYGTGLRMMYLPYARQDKAVSNDATFALIPFLKLLGSLDFSCIEMFDVHNPEVVRQLLPKAIMIEPTKEIPFAARAVRADCVCFPDAGARVRYTSIIGGDNIYAEKVRDQATGNITGLTLHGNPQGLRVLIVDDLCDGGMTFIKLAERLLEAGADEVHLYVSHGLFTKGLAVLHHAGIQRIFTREGEVK